MKHHPPISRRAAFTLIELLVVVVIVIVLISLLVPNLLRGRDLAHAASCAGRLRLIGVGLTHYVADGGFYPIMDYRDPGGSGGASITWCELIYPYMTGRPAPTTTPQVDDSFTDPAVQNKRGTWNRPYVLTYMINASRTGGIAGEPTNGMTTAQMDALRVPVAAVPEPSKTFAVVDGRRSPYTFLEANTHFVRNGGEMNIWPHDGYNNWLFCDGHVQSLLASTTYGSNGTPTNCRGIWTRAMGD